MTLFHDADSGSKSFHFVALIGTERHVNDYHGTFYTTYYGLSVINHLVERDGQRGYVTCHYIGSGVAYEDNIHSCTVYNLCHRVVIGSKHRNLFASLFHFNQAMSSHLSCVI